MTSVDSLEWQISYLSDHPEFLETIVGWFYDEWGGDRPDRSRASIREAVLARMNHDRLPLIRVGHHAGRPIATASIKIREMDIRSRFPYWLGSVFVEAGARGRGYGSRIVEDALEIASRFNIDKLYIYTRGHERFYARLGWVEFERCRYRRKEVILMVREIA